MPASQPIANKLNCTVLMMDLLGIIPFYNRYLVDALKQQDCDIKLASVNHYLDRDFFNRHGTPRLKGLFDPAWIFRIKRKKVIRVYRALGYSFNLVRLSAYLLLKRPQVLHVQWLPMLGSLPIELAVIKFSKRLGITVVYTAHNILPHDTGHHLKEKYLTVYRAVDFLICHTRSAADRLSNEFDIPAGKISVIPHGPMLHDLRTTSPNQITEEHSQDNKSVTFLFFGSIRPYKGLEFLLDAWNLAVADMPKASLEIMGAGEQGYIDLIQDKIIQLNIAESVTSQFSYIEDNELVAHLEASHVLLYPYQNIDQSGALLTGMSFSKPIIATNLEGFKETLVPDQTAIFVDYGDTKQLSETLKYLYNTPSERERLGMNTAKDFGKQYSWGRISKQTMDVYQRKVT